MKGRQCREKISKKQIILKEHPLSNTAIYNASSCNIMMNNLILFIDNTMKAIRITKLSLLC